MATQKPRKRNARKDMLDLEDDFNFDQDPTITELGIHNHGNDRQGKDRTEQETRQKKS